MTEPQGHLHAGEAETLNYKWLEENSQINMQRHLNLEESLRTCPQFQCCYEGGNETRSTENYNLQQEKYCKQTMRL